MTEQARQRRRRGSGSIYQRASDGLWVAKVSIPTPRGEPRRAKVIASRDRATTEAKLAAWMAENRPDAPPPDAPLTRPIDRYYALAAAKARGTHTDKEWRAKKIAADHRCYYCKRHVGPSGGEPDHVIPVSRGGSDAIDNIVLACQPCNSAKSATPADEFIAWAERAGFFTRPRPWEQQ